MSASKQTCMLTRTIYHPRHVKHAVRGGRSNGSPSPEDNLNGVSLMLALLALSTADSCETFGMRMLKDRSTGPRSELVKRRDRARSRGNLAGV